jgi:ribulose-5-phosphate 4-epimerase/fuculose-1-phosphate aldolase
LPGHGPRVWHKTIKAAVEIMIFKEHLVYVRDAAAHVKLLGEKEAYSRMCHCHLCSDKNAEI